MLQTRRRFLALTAPGVLGLVSLGRGQESASARLGILLDTSAEMGFLVVQARKELRILNEQLTAAGHPAVPLREIEGASLDREGSTAVGARRNVIYALKELFAEVDTVLWITKLGGDQSPQGIFAVEEMLKEMVLGGPARQLVIQHIWQEQIQAGDAWVRHPPGLESDPLDLRNRPEEWYRLVGEGGGVIRRSWQCPPPDLRAAFAFPHRVVGSAYLKQLNLEGKEALFDQGWAGGLATRHGLKFSREKEEWLPRITGRRWLMEATFLPFPDNEALAARSTQVLGELSVRETIEEDLARIDAVKLGVVFGFGYVGKDMKRHFSLQDRPPSTWRDHYFADLVRIGGECTRNAQENASRPDRIYATERVELARTAATSETPDPVTRRIARMVRDESVDAVYLFTSGYLGDGEYGTWSLDLGLLALAIREAGTRLFVRVPFELSPTPVALAQLAMASGGGVFCGKAGDSDWETEIPDPAWPVAVEEA